MSFSTVSSTSLTKSLSSTSLLSSTISNNKEYNNYNITNAGIVLLAGGKGERMQSAVPKQFLSLLGKPVFLRSLDIFKFLDKNIISSIVIVLDESYREEYQYLLREDSRIVWANPGKERQDSVYNGIQAIPDSCSIVGKKIAYWID
jgi:2-C-methyl-D-erythritol 4-phosphate cytidylyltransferase